MKINVTFCSNTIFILQTVFKYIVLHEDFLSYDFQTKDLLWNSVREYMCLWWVVLRWFFFFLVVTEKCSQYWIFYASKIKIKCHTKKNLKLFYPIMNCSLFTVPFSSAPSKLNVILTTVGVSLSSGSGVLTSFRLLNQLNSIYIFTNYYLTTYRILYNTDQLVFIDLSIAWCITP